MKRNKRTLMRVELILVGLLVLVLIFLSLLLFRQKIGEVSSTLSDTNISYENYYVIITDDRDSAIWQSIYTGAAQAGMESADAYVEFMGIQSPTDYTIQEKLRIAIDSGVSGIIISADGSEETTSLIDEAVEKGIPVVTALYDDSSSLRQCFVGVNSYSLGETYGEIAWKNLNEKEELSDCRITILMDGDSANTGHNTTYLGLKEYLDLVVEKSGWEYDIFIEAIAVNRDETFQADETIGNLIIEGNVDILICLNAEDTESAYQAIVDYNKVGNIEIIGYYESEIILEAIEKEVINATVMVSGEEVGYRCIMAMEEYFDAGYVNGYIPMGIKVLTADNVSEYLAKYQEDDGYEDE
ncbi:MAG: substrate-binding domain-containing protein [Eubacteriales bacterium]